MVKIVIPTRGRVGEQQTLLGLSPEMRERTMLVCPVTELQGHLRFLADRNMTEATVVAQPAAVTTIAQKRKWIMEELARRGEERVIMLDDDLFFYHRYWKHDCNHGKGDWRLADSDPHTVWTWLTRLAERLSPDMPHGGFGPRQGNNNFPTGWVEGTRMMLALAYHVPTALRSAVWGRIETREDMDVSLQLLRKGLPNNVTHDFCVGQKTYAAPGGCTGQRTTESSDADAHRLAELHPGLVRVVEKEYKGHPRKEVVVQWKRALAEGRSGAQRS